MACSLFSSLEPLESRIAPAALVVLHDLPNIVAGNGKTGATIDLGNMFDPSGSFHTHVTFHTNFDSDPNTAGVQGDITIELYDDTAPLTVQNFLAYAANPKIGAGYVNTFFHRLVNSSGGLQILQGGGYTASDFKHIASLPPVINEFGASNTLGSVAMAKLDQQPNSATNEFFFNLGDNSSNLDNQNGGFTVFGKLVPNSVDDSLAVVQAIAQQATIKNLTPNSPNSPFTTVPTRGGYSDLSKLPTSDQLFRINSVQVQAPLLGHSPGVTYQVSVTNPADAPSLVTASPVTGGNFSGELLHLKYNPAEAGTATIHVTATKGTDSVTESFTAAVLPYLTISALDPLASTIVPGDTGNLTVKLGNVGAGGFDGKVNVQASLVDAGSEHVPDRVIASIHGVDLHLAGGTGTSKLLNLQVPTTLELQPGEPYRLVLQVVAADGTTLPAQTYNGLSVVTPNVHTEANAFGNFAGRTDVAIHYLDGGSHDVRIVANGGGYGSIFYEGNDVTKPLDLSFHNTSSATNVLATVAGAAHTSFGNIFVAQSVAGAPATAALPALGVVNLATVDLTGDFVASGGLKSLQMGNLSSIDGTTRAVVIGDFNEAPGQFARVSLGLVNDYSFQSNEAISTLTVKSWISTNATVEGISGTFMDSFADSGSLQAGFVLHGTRAMKSFTVAESIVHSEVQIGGNVGAVRLGGMEASDFLVGAFRNSSGGFTPYSTHTIGSFTLQSASAGGAAVLSDSNIVAAKFGVVNVDQVDTASGTGQFGFTADVIAEYHRNPVAFFNLHAPSNPVDVSGHYQVTLM